MSDPALMSDLDPIKVEESVNKRKAKNPVSAQNAATAAAREERLASGSAPKASPAPSAPAQIEEPKDRSALLDRIVAYRERFPKLKSRNKVSGKSTTEEIEDELHYIEQQLGSREGSSIPLLLIALGGIEQVSHVYNPLGLKLTGLASVAKDNSEQFEPIMDELMIKYGASVAIGPEFRLVLAIGSLVYTVHSANSGDLRTAAAMKKMSEVVNPPAGANDL